MEIWGRTLGWISADGLDWSPLEEALGERPVNGGISARYDADKGQYIAYLQIMGNAAEIMPGIGSARLEEETQRRTIGFACTRDFCRWPAPKLILSPDAQDDLDISFYGANYFPYPGRTDLHAMLIPIYHQATDHADTQIAFSRDGLFWTRPAASLLRYRSCSRGALHYTADLSPRRSVALELSLCPRRLDPRRAVKQSALYDPPRRGSGRGI